MGINIGSTSATGVWIGGGNNDIAREGLIFWIDSGNYRSYTGSGTTIYDLSGNNNNGTISGGPSFSNGYLDFDGTDDYINVANDLGTLTSFTLEVWAKKDVASGPHYYIDSRNGSTSYFWFLSEYNSYDYNFHDTSRFNDSNSYVNWHQIVVTENAVGSAIYLNGVQKDIGTTSSGIGANMRIGTRYTGASFWNGQMAIVRVYNRDISASEILYNFHATRARFGI